MDFFTDKIKKANQRIQWNKKGAFFQVIICRVYGAINLNRTAFLSTDSKRSMLDNSMLENIYAELFGILITVVLIDTLYAYRLALQRHEHAKILVKELRSRLELTQEQFASEVGVTYSTVNNWENGKRTPQPFLLRRLLEMKDELIHRGQSPE